MGNTEVTLLKNFMLEVLPYLFMLCGFSFSLNEKRLKTGLFFWLMTMVYIVYSIIGHAYEITAIYSGLFLLTNIFWATTFVKPYLSFNIPTILLPLTWTGLGVYVFYKSVYLIGILMIVIGVLGLCLNAIIIKKQWNPNYWGLLFYPLTSLIIVSIFFEEIQVLGWCGITILCIVIIYLIKKSGMGRPIIGLHIPCKTYPLNNNAIKYSKFNRALIDKINRKNVVNNRPTKTQEEKINIICSNCGEKLLSDSVFCVKCGTIIQENQTIFVAKNIISIFKKYKNKIIGASGITIAILLVVFIVNSIQISKLKEQLLRDWENVEGDVGSQILCILDFSDDKIEYRIETGYRWMDTTIATYNYKIINGNKIKVNTIGNTWESIKIKFNNDKTMMTITPALTNINNKERWFQLD